MLKQTIKFVLLLLFCQTGYSAPIIQLDQQVEEGIYIGKSIEYLNERDLFVALKDQWGVEAVYFEKMLSGELHSEGEMNFTQKNATLGYRARMRLADQPGSQRILTWGVEDVANRAATLPFIHSDQTILNLSFMPHAWWLQFKIRHIGSSPTEVYLQLDKHVSGRIDLFYPVGDSWRVKRGNFTQNWEKRDQPDKNITFGFKVKPGLTTCYVRVNGWFVDSIPLRLWTHTGYKSQTIVDNAFQKMVMGGYLFIFIFNIFIFLSVRDTSYIYLSLMAVSSLVTHLGFSGVGFQTFWPGNAVTGIHVLMLSISLSYIFSLQFCRSFINIRQISPRIDRIIVYLMQILLALIVLYAVLPSSISRILFASAIFIDYLFYLPVLFAAIVSVKQGNRSGIYLLIGIGMHYLSLVEWALTSFDIIPYQYINYIHIKGASFLIIMTLGLSDKISTMKNSLADLNLNLEKKVRERTDELAIKTEEIEKANEQLRELDQVKSRFFANISHEIRTPLTLLISPIESLLKGEHGKIPQKGLALIETMGHNAGRLLRLVNDLLDFSKIEAGRMAVNHRNCSIPKLLSTCVSSIGAAAADKHIQVSFIDRTGGLHSLVDSDLLEKAVFNLLSNAIKFNREGGSITVSLHQEAADLVITVEDTGIGIPIDQQEHIFERFSQVDNSSTRKFGGTGIGLSLTREIVELHNGQISVGSQQGNGSTFQIRIPDTVDPVKERETTVETEVELPAADPALEGTRPESKPEANILITEDNEEMLAFLCSLTERHYTVLTATTGKEALKVLEQQEVDLLLADIMMPEMDGLELVTAVRSRPSTEELPIILLTAKSLTREIVDGIEKGANDYITKPFSPDELMARI
jgi:signal transduction histidine kinase/CheY-like chemotaxis protein